MLLAPAPLTPEGNKTKRQVLTQVVSSLFHLTTYHHINTLQICDDLFSLQLETLLGKVQPQQPFCHTETLFTPSEERKYREDRRGGEKIKVKKENRRDKTGRRENKRRDYEDMEEGKSSENPRKIKKAQDQRRGEERRLERKLGKEIREEGGERGGAKVRKRRIKRQEEER